MFDLVGMGESGMFELLERQVFVVSLAHPTGHALKRILVALSFRGRNVSARLFESARLVDEEDLNGLTGPR